MKVGIFAPFLKKKIYLKSPVSPDGMDACGCRSPRCDREETWCGVMLVSPEEDHGFWHWLPALGCFAGHGGAVVN